MSTAQPRPRPAAGPSTLQPAQRTRRAALELLPPFVVALVLLPFVIAYGHIWPWRPSTIDLEVYVYAVKDMLAGRDIFATTTPFWHLYFIYPPIAAVLMVPLAFGPYALWQIVWTAALVWAQQSVLARCGIPRGWKLMLAGIVTVLAVEPIRTTLGYGQVNTLLMAFVVIDLLPDQRSRRVLPAGVLIGLAAAIKLTPALFVVFLLLLGRRRAAVTAMITFVALTLVGALVLPRQTLSYWTGLAGGDTRTASPLYVGNQSLLGVAYRLVGSGGSTAAVALAIAGVVALTAVVVAAWWWQRGERVFAVALVGLATCLASPLSWTHHHVWILPMGVALVLGTRIPRWARGVATAWVVWVCVCLPLAVLPYGANRELRYSAFQEVVANLGPLLGLVLVVGLAVQVVAVQRRAHRALPAGPQRPRAAPSAAVGRTLAE